MSSALTLKKPVEDISFLNKVFCPWENKKGGCLSHTGYWITFLVLGLLTCFIPHFLYYCARHCASSKPPVTRIYEPIEVPTTPSILSTQNISGIVTLTRLPPQSTPPPAETKYSAPTPFSSTSPPPPPQSDRSAVDNTRSSSSASSMTSAPTLTKWADDFDIINDYHAEDYESFTPTVKPTDSRMAALEGLRISQAALQTPFDPHIAPPLSQLCMKVVALQADQIPKKKCFTGIAFMDNVKLFRLDTTLNEEHIKKTLNAWPNQEKNENLQVLNLHGCTHLTLTGSVLVHKNFTKLDFTGCKFDNLDECARDLAKQKSLAELYLGYEQPLSVDAFRHLIAECPELRKLSAAVSVKEDKLFANPCKLEYLTIRAPSISHALLCNIFSSCPDLKGISIWIEKREGEIDLRKVIKEHKPKGLPYANFIVDTTTPLESTAIRVKRTNIYLTQIDTSSLFSLTADASPVNFTQNSFSMLVSRYSHHAEKLHMLLRQAAKSNNRAEGLDILTACGRALAEKTVHDDLEALTKIIDPFPLEIEGESSAAYNVNLELILRSALEHCDSQAKENESSAWAWNKHKNILIHILNKFSSIFETSAAIFEASTQ